MKPSKLPADALCLPYWGNQSSYNARNNALNQENTYAEFCLSVMQHLIICYQYKPVFSWMFVWVFYTF